MAFDKNNMPLGMKIVVVIFAIILIISMCLPFFSSCNAPSVPTESPDAAQREEAQPSAATTVAAIDAAYQPQIASLTAKLDADPESLAALGNLGNTCMDWGTALQQASDAGTDEAAAHIEDVFTAAINYYDQYLERDPESRAVRVDRACCEFYAGDEEGAIADLEEFCAENDSFSLAWFNLGVFYYQRGELASAKEAFDKAVEADAVESFNVSTMASIYASMVQAEIDAQETAEAEADASAEAENADGAAADAASAADTSTEEEAADVADEGAAASSAESTDASDAATGDASEDEEERDADHEAADSDGRAE